MQRSAPAQALTVDEGLAVIGAAMESRHHPPKRRDCSHFVNAVYERAGFPYSYQNSISMYDGISEFERVSRPQPGDVIVWRGHMGVIVNPVQHSFFSALRTGLGVENYESPYWKRRGRPRFYRYVKTEPGTSLMLAAAKEPVNDSSADQPKVVIPENPLAQERASLPAEEAPPLAVVGHPTNANVQRVLEDGLNANGDLPPADILNSSKTVIIYDSFQVKNVHLKKDQGWAEIHMNEPSALIGGQADLQRRSDRQRWILIRTGKNSWEVARPSDAIYIPKQAAVRLLAHELAAMTADRSAPRRGAPQEAELARLLDNLLGE